MNDDLRISDRGIDLIKAFEGIMDGDPSTANLDPYICPAGYVTIGWGHVVLDNGNMLKGRGGLARAKELIPNGITMEEAENLLIDDCIKFERAVKRTITTEVTQGQFDAMVSLSFNIGPANFRTSTVARETNAGRWDAAADAFMMWNKARDPNTGILKVLNGLVRRRQAERELYLSEL